MFRNIYTPSILKKTGLVNPVNPKGKKYSEVYFWSMFSTESILSTPFYLNFDNKTSWFSCPERIEKMWSEFDPHTFLSYVPDASLFNYYSTRNDPDTWLPVPESQLGKFSKKVNYGLPNGKIIDAMISYYGSRTWNDYDILVYVWYVLAGYSHKVHSVDCNPILPLFSRLTTGSFSVTTRFIEYLRDKSFEHYDDDIDAPYWTLMTQVIVQAPDMRKTGRWEINKSIYSIPFNTKIFSISQRVDSFGFCSTWNVIHDIPYKHIGMYIDGFDVLRTDLMFVMGKSGDKLMLVTCSDASFRVVSNQIDLFFNFIFKYPYHYHTYINVFLDSIAQYIERRNPWKTEIIHLHVKVDKWMTFLQEKHIVEYSYHEWVIKIAPHYMFRTYCETFVLTDRLQWSQYLFDLFVMSLDIVKFQIYLDAAMIDQYVLPIIGMVQDRRAWLLNRRNTLHYFLSIMIVSVESFYQKIRGEISNHNPHLLVYLACNYYTDIAELVHGTSLGSIFNMRYPDGLREYMVSSYFHVKLDYAELKHVREMYSVREVFKNFYLRCVLRNLFYLNKDTIEAADVYDLHINQMDVPVSPVRCQHVSGRIFWGLDDEFVGGVNVSEDQRYIQLAPIDPQYFEFIDLVPYRLELERSVFPKEFMHHHFARGNYLVNTVTDILWKDNSKKIRRFLEEDRKTLFYGSQYDQNMARYNNSRCLSMFDPPPPHDVLQFTYRSAETTSALEDVN